MSERDREWLEDDEATAPPAGSREAQERREAAEGPAAADAPVAPPPILEGEDDVPRQPAPPLDPYTPEPGPRPGERRAWQLMRLAIIPVLVGLALVLWAALR